MAKYQSPPSPCETCPDNKRSQAWCNKNCKNEDILAAGRVFAYMCAESEKEKKREKRGNLK